MKLKTKKKQLARKVAKDLSIIRKARIKAGQRDEASLLAAAPVLCFCGDVIIQSREAAVSKAMAFLSYGEDQLVYFTDGAVHITRDEHAQAALDKRRRKASLGAAIAHTAIGGSEWTVTSFSVAQGATRDYLVAEMAGIAGALAIAISSITNQQRIGSATTRRVVILSDCQTALASSWPEETEYACPTRTAIVWRRSRESKPKAVATVRNAGVATDFTAAVTYRARSLALCLPITVLAPPLVGQNKHRPRFGAAQGNLGHAASAHLPLPKLAGR
ncbi:hypothetical protein S7711_00864 [Stachybotrys chartarum IBT 7711]|uniref:Uncharacterized protein n=1 Tax=Stachybotrys chartarum (strain CBS 109288 / IBT 7711) TaxID=1280523 RepID=A0A084B0G1_STACB|nr:hypothetical protein S7711_00864 [Stachybotrys chartarum IBT 7711]